MKLICVDFQGFRRLKDASIDLSDDVVAVVGPNEAGKTSLLQGLQHLSTDEDWESGDCTRGLSDSRRPRVSALYVLSPEERALRKVTGGEGDDPKWLKIVKSSNGQRDFEVKPALRRSFEARRALDKHLESLPRHSRLKEYLNQTVPYQQDDKTLRRSMAKAVEMLREYTNSESQTLASEALDLALGIKDVLRGQLKNATEAHKGALIKFIATLEKFSEAESLIHPNEALLAKLRPRIPKILLFGNPDRQLQSEYPLGSVANPPAALGNFLKLARVDSRKLNRAIQAQDHGQRSKIEEKANEALRAAFRESWSQSRVAAHLQIDEQRLRIQVDAPDTYSPIAERSDGLRAFIALFAYVSANAPDATKPILLIDEAETHLHYDAQADLINVLENQREAAKVIYSTHSAGCLPSDLGTGIRIIRPDIQDEEDQGVSVIENSFWTRGAGFSPLTLAMGASVMALVPTRRAIIAEGGSDVILLPTLLRAVNPEGSLGFQIAPGLANVARSKIQELELEAPRVAYLVDGDDAGRRHKKKLISAGISAERIVSLPKGKVPEDFIKKLDYIDAVNEEFRRSYGDEYNITRSEIGPSNRLRSVGEWCKNKGINSPSKTTIASRLARRMKDGKVSLEKRIEAKLLELRTAIERALR